MNEQQKQLILQIIKEQLDDYLADDLAMRIFYGIAEGLEDNMPLLEDMGVLE